jgi:antitoxin FitA
MRRSDIVADIQKEFSVPAILVRNISAETHRALRLRARKHGRSTEAEIRAILDGVARPARRMRLGSALAALARPFGGLDLELTRDKTPAEPADLA